MSDLTGQKFAGYEILAKLGQGGMGAVYKARQPLLNRIVALKVMSPHLSDDEAFVARFVREASTAANLQHPNMVMVHTAGEHEGVYHIVMEFVEGMSLHEHIQEVGRLDPCEALAITVYVAKALQYAWQKSRMIHRDIKPANIFLSHGGEVKLGDLGLAKSQWQSTAGVTVTGMVMGTAQYMSPEQARAVKEIDFRSDIYSLGCTLYHMLVGHAPYEDTETMAVMLKQINDPPVAVFKAWPQCPPALGRLVNRMLAKQPAQRHQSYEELIAELMEVHDRLKVELEKTKAQSTVVINPLKSAADAAAAEEPALPPSPEPEPKRRPVIAYTATALLSLVLVGGLIWWAPWKKAKMSASADGTFPQPDSLEAKAPDSAPPGMALIPAGPFMMGDNLDGETRSMPVHQVTVSAFCMDKYLVTKALWKEVYDWAIGHGYKFDNAGDGKAPDHPIAYVSWYDCVKWCNARSEKEGQVPAYYTDSSQTTVYRTGNVDLAVGCVKWLDGYRLPTEAEWEKAARGGLRGKRFPWGDTISHSQANYESTGSADYDVSPTRGRLIGKGGCSPVTNFPPNGYRLFDMAGNALQWCWDWQNNDYYAVSPGANPRGLDSVGKNNQAARVLRGGSSYSTPPSCRTAHRSGHTPDYLDKSVGFRTVLPATEFASIPSPLNATKSTPWTNSLGMPFVPVPGTKVLFCVWDTRVKDYEGFVRAVGREWARPTFSQAPTHPAVNVSWDDAKAFCAWLERKEQGERVLAPGQHYRLPSDKEWSSAVGLPDETGDFPMDKAAKNKDAIYPWGTQWPPPRGAGNYAAGINTDTFEKTSPVGSFPPNKFGLCDMGGNVWQWCEDWFNDNRTTRVLRGACWQSEEANKLLSSVRNPQPPTLRQMHSGFRIVLETPTLNASSDSKNPATAFPPGQWVKAVPDMAKLPNLAEFKDGWATL